jgi:hypothetical protein
MYMELSKYTKDFFGIVYISDNGGETKDCGKNLLLSLPRDGLTFHNLLFLPIMLHYGHLPCHCPPFNNCISCLQSLFSLLSYL